MFTTGGRTTARAGRAALALLLALTALAATATAAEAQHDSPFWPRVEIQQDGPMLEVVRPGSVIEGERLAYRLSEVDSEVVVDGEVDRPQIKLVLAIGRTYSFTVRSFQPGVGWSRWSYPVTVTGGDTDAYPWAVQARAVDGGAVVDWADTGADSYHLQVWTYQGLVASVDVAGLSTTIDGLQNGNVYGITVQSRYGQRLTRRSPAIPVTPSDRPGATVELRDFDTEPLEGPTRLRIPVAVTGDTGRLGGIQTYLASTGRFGPVAGSTFDPDIEATTGISGAWVTDELTIDDLDHEVITLAWSSDGTIASSSLQTWLLGRVDGFAPGSSPFTRVGTFR